MLRTVGLLTLVAACLVSCDAQKPLIGYTGGSFSGRWLVDPANGDDRVANQALDYIETMGFNSWSYLVTQSTPQHSLAEERQGGSWPQIVAACRAAARRHVDFYLTFHDPIYYQRGDFGQEGRAMLYKEWFAEIARACQGLPNFRGFIIDDFGEHSYWEEGGFTDAHGRPLLTPEYLKDLRTTLRQANPDVKVFVVLYWFNMTPDAMTRWVDPRMPYLDGLVFPYSNQSAGPGADPQDWSNFERELATLRRLWGKLPIYVCVYHSSSKWRWDNVDYMRRALQQVLKSADGLYYFYVSTDMPVAAIRNWRSVTGTSDVDRRTRMQGMTMETLKGQ